ncbi:MAG: hypothetical protein QNL04_01425 [SAR324 cluster bacterium]|nr:hypothetical protein [SAR324 cluster bacterium]
MIEVTSPSSVYAALSKATTSLQEFQGTAVAQIRSGQIEIGPQKKSIQKFWQAYEEILATVQEFQADMPNSDSLAEEMYGQLRMFFDQIEDTELLLDRADADQQLESQQAQLCKSLNIQVNDETTTKTLLKKIEAGITERLRLKVQMGKIDTARFTESIGFVHSIFEAYIAIKTKSPKNLEGEGLEKYRLLLDIVKEKLALMIKKLAPEFKQESSYIDCFSNVVENFVEDAEETGLNLDPDAPLDKQILKERGVRVKGLFQKAAVSRTMIQQQKKALRSAATQSSRSTPSLTGKADDLRQNL